MDRSDIFASLVPHAALQPEVRTPNHECDSVRQIVNLIIAHASRRALRALLSMRSFCFNKIGLILRRPRSGRLDRAE